MAPFFCLPARSSRFAYAQRDKLLALANWFKKKTFSGIGKGFDTVSPPGLEPGTR